MARTVQRSLLPTKMPDLPGFTLAASWNRPLPQRLQTPPT